jgi:hypothetical protein
MFLSLKNQYKCLGVTEVHFWLLKVKIATRVYTPRKNEYVILQRQRYIISMARVRERTIPTERVPLIGEVSANFCG